MIWVSQFLSEFLLDPTELSRKRIAGLQNGPLARRYPGTLP